MTDSLDSTKLLQILETVVDPEIPVLTIADLGILRHATLREDGVAEVTITPTYSGCPAMDFIEVNIRAALEESGFHNSRIIKQLSPAWTTAWMTDAGREKLRKFGIAPPIADSMDKSTLFAEDKKVPCPHCESSDTELVSQFGSTSCKALYRCKTCKEPFDYFKCH